MNANELQQKTEKELETLANELRATIRDARFKLAVRQLSKVHTVRDAKRSLARVLAEVARRARATKA